MYNLESDYFSASNATVLFEVIRATSFVNITNVVNGVVNGTNATITFNIINRTNVKIIITNSTGDVILTYDGFNGDSVSIGNLTEYARSKGFQVELAGAEIVMNTVDPLEYDLHVEVQLCLEIQTKILKWFESKGVNNEKTNPRGGRV